jgi:hypothetical protein
MLWNLTLVMDSFTVRKLQGYKTVASIVYQGLYRELALMKRAVMLWVGGASLWGDCGDGEGETCGD